MLDDLTIGIEVDLTPFTAGMAEVETRVSSAPTINLTPIASEFNVVTNAMSQTAVAATSIDTTNVVQSLETVQASIEGVSTAASNAHFNIGGLGRTFTAVAIATKPLAAVPGQFGLISGAAGLAAGAAAHVAAAFGLASTLATHMAVGLSIILAPLRGLVLVPRLIAASFSLMFAVVLAPFRVLGFAAIATAKAMWMLLQPVLKLAAAIFKLKLFFATLKIQLTLLKLFFGALPPKIRLVVGGLIALGAAGRVGAAAASLVGKAMGALAFAALAVRSPLKAVGFAALKTALTLGRFTRSVVRSTKAMLRFAFTKTVMGLKAVGTAAISVAGNISGRLLGALKTDTVRVIPVFPELRPFLKPMWSAEHSDEWLLPRLRSGSGNVRTQFERLIKRAGLKQWPNLWNTLRSTRETELAQIHPLHVVCEWIGNSPAVAQRHYLKPTDEDFARAVRAENAPKEISNDSHHDTPQDTSQTDP